MTSAAMVLSAALSMPTPAEELLRRVKAGFMPPPDLTVSEFSDRELMVTVGPHANTHWRTDFAPYQRGILDAFHEPGVEIVVVMGSSQWGKTSCAVNIVAYHIAHDPCPILVVQPTVDPMAKDFARNRLEPVIRASPRLLECVGKKRAKDSSNTTLQKTFRGGSLAIGGANSAASLAARSTRLLVLDEVDRYPAELPGEGSTLAIAIKRTAAYQRRRRIFMPSSPTLKGGPIDTWHKRGDQRRYYVPCPSCGHMHALQWANVKWQNDDPRTALLHCPACDYGIGEAERVAILSRGEWRAEATEPGDPAIVSFHLWEAYSPLSSLAEIVSGFMRARELQKAGDKSEMHTWQNTTLGEPIEPDAGEGVESHVLLMRREEYGSDAEGRYVDMPGGACCLTMGVDVQDDRLEVLVIGWGPGEESWIVDRQTLSGDTQQPEPWKELDEVLNHPYLHASGQRLSVQATCIDSAGHRTTLVYDYAARQAARRVYAVIGRDGQRPIVSSPSPRKWGREKRQVPLYTIGVDAAKALIVSRLAMTEKGRGYVHIPHVDWADEELAAQLSSERLVTRFSKGVPSQVWKKTRPRNEALDCAVYALGALRLLHPDLDLLANRLATPAAYVPQPKPQKPRWIPPRRRGWLR
jgi:phage terminase large subunit GpA-like protein